MALSTTSFKNISVQIKIYHAMRKSMNEGVAFLENRKGKRYAMVERVKGAVRRCFRFTDVNGNDITEMVYKGLKSC